MTFEEVIGEVVRGAVARELGGIREELAALKSLIPPRMLTVAQAAEALGCCKGTVRRMVQAGTIAYKRVGLGRNGIRIDAASLHGAGGDPAP